MKAAAKVDVFLLQSICMDDCTRNIYRVCWHYACDFEDERGGNSKRCIARDCFATYLGFGKRGDQGRGRIQVYGPNFFFRLSCVMGCGWKMVVGGRAKTHAVVSCSSLFLFSFSFYQSSLHHDGIT